MTSRALGEALRVEVRRRVDAGDVHIAVLARRCEMSQPQLSNWLAGRRALSFDAFDMVRCRLGVPWCELLPCDGCNSVRRALAA